MAHIWVYGPGGGWKFFAHGADEWGNCTLYWGCPWLGTIVWRYPTGHRQTDVLLPCDMDGIDAAEWMTRHHLGRDEWLEQFPERAKTATQAKEGTRG